jgi:hypothetical protein
VKIAKKILRQNDIFLALMSYRATPIEATGMSPAEMMMGRKIHTLVPALPETLDLAWPDSDDIRLRDASYKDRAKNYYDCHFNTRPFTEMEEGNYVRIKTDREKSWSAIGTVRECDYDNRSYVVETPKGVYRRNRRHLQLTSDVNSPDVDKPIDCDLPSKSTVQKTDDSQAAPKLSSPSSEPTSNPNQTRSGLCVVKPKRF